MSGDHDLIQKLVTRRKFLSTAVGAGALFFSRPTFAQFDTTFWKKKGIVTGKFLATSRGTAAAFSDDGITWKTTTLPVSRYWRYAASNGSKWVTIPSGDINGSAVSNSTIHEQAGGWISSTLPVSQLWGYWNMVNNIVWNGSIFCVSSFAANGWGLTNVVLTSPDGISWTQRALPLNMNWGGMAWNGSQFMTLAVGGPGGSQTKSYATSPDGITWTAHSTLPSNRYWAHIAWNGSVWCAIPLFGWNIVNSNVVATSADGINWTERTLPVSRMWGQLIWTGSNFCAIAFAQGSAPSFGATNTVVTSPDGISWTTRVLPAVRYWTSIAHNGGNIVAVAGNYIQGYVNSPSNTSATSTDGGSTWTLHNLPSSQAWFINAQ